MNRDPREDFKQLVGGRIFTCEFTKKDGTVRKMVARVGVKKHLRGGNSTISAYTNLLPVYDLEKQEYRCINIDTIRNLKCGNIRICWGGDTHEKV